MRLSSSLTDLSRVVPHASILEVWNTPSGVRTAYPHTQRSNQCFYCVLCTFCVLVLRISITLCDIYTKKIKTGSISLRIIQNIMCILYSSVTPSTHTKRKRTRTPLDVIRPWTIQSFVFRRFHTETDAASSRQHAASLLSHQTREATSGYLHFEWQHCFQWGYSYQKDARMCVLACCVCCLKRPGCCTTPQLMCSAFRTIRSCFSRHFRKKESQTRMHWKKSVVRSPIWNWIFQKKNHGITFQGKFKKVLQLVYPEVQKLKSAGHCRTPTPESISSLRPFCIHTWAL